MSRVLPIHLGRILDASSNVPNCDPQLEVLQYLSHRKISDQALHPNNASPALQLDGAPATDQFQTATAVRPPQKWRIMPIT